MSSDTKPCPFCGATGIIFKETDTEKWGAAYCPQCGAAGPDVRTGYNMEPDAPWHKDALEEWNKRAEKYIYSSYVCAYCKTDKNCLISWRVCKGTFFVGKEVFVNEIKS